MLSAFRLISFQAVIALVIIAGFWLFSSPLHAYSATVAAAICIIANTFFARFIFRFHGAQQVKAFIRAYFLGEFIKLALIIVLMLLSLRFLHIKAMPFLLTFVILQLFIGFLPAVKKR